MGAPAFIAAIVLIIMGILGLIRKLGWAHTQVWRAVLEIIIGVVVIIFLFFSGMFSGSGME
jgi:hypothetical protein